MLSRPAQIGLFASVFLHLAAFFLVDQVWRGELEGERFRARLAALPRFRPPERLAVARPDMPRAVIEYLPSERTPESAGGQDLSLSAGLPVEAVGPILPEALAIPEEHPKPKAPLFAGEVMPSPSGPVWVDSLESEAMELLRMEDLARADDRRAMVIPDLYSRRDLTGYVNFTYLRMDGMSNIGSSLEGLARYLRDHTRILGQVRHRPTVYFLSEQLLKDPIHFMFPGPRLGGGDLEKKTFMSETELTLLGRYLRGGGFLFVEGGSADALTSEGYGGWLAEMIVHVHDALKGQGRYFEIPAAHPIYHSFYDFDTGFPGEDKTRMLEVPPPAWYFARGVKDRPGLWGVELGGELVAVFSDGGVNASWSQADEDGGSLLSLQTATNVVVYALTRPRGLTPKRLPPAWQARRPIVSPNEGLAADLEPDDRDLFDDLEASLVLVRAPLGDRIERGGVKLVLDGRYRLEMLKKGRHGVLLHNLPAGRHWVEVVYGGQSRQIEVDMQGGRVSTVTFGLIRLAVWTRLHLKVHREQIRVEDWRQRFSDLEVEEIYYEEGRAGLEGLAPGR